MEWTDIMWITAVLVGLLFYYFTSTFGFFDHRRLPFRKPIPFVGNMAPVVFKQKHIALLSQDFYAQFKNSGVGGVFEFRRPVLVVCDPDVARLICVREFDSFADHNTPVTEGGDGFFGRNLVALTGRDWRNIRATLNPAFASSKMEELFGIVSACGRRAATHIDAALREHASGKSKDTFNIEIKSFYSKVINDVLAATVFGADCDSLKQPNNEFFLKGKDVTDFNGRKALVALGHIFAPPLMQLLRPAFLRFSTKRFFHSLVKDGLKERHVEQKTLKGDLLQMMALARKELLETKAGEEEEAAPPPRGTNLDLTDDEVAAQALLFFLAGFETTTTVLSFLSYLLAVHPEVQQRVQEELDQQMTKNGKKLTYDVIKNLTYLDMVISETMRMYPPSPIIDRKCSKGIPMRPSEKCGGYIMATGDTVWIPVYAIHHDSEFFPDPDKFDPERFSEANRPNIKPFTYMPFGVGPRSCIGVRFALLQIKTVAAYLLSQYSFKVTDKTPIPLKLSKKTFQMTADEGFWVGLQSRENGYVQAK